MSAPPISCQDVWLRTNLSLGINCTFIDRVKFLIIAAIPHRQRQQLEADQKQSRWVSQPCIISTFTSLPRPRAKYSLCENPRTNRARAESKSRQHVLE
ncbi:hypothetical protein LTS17_006700 [Exophiala oligosperma]